MATFISLVALYLLSIGLSCLVMINGWGMAPQSWGWILGGAFGQLVILTVVQLLKEDK